VFMKGIINELTVLFCSLWLRLFNIDRIEYKTLFTLTSHKSFLGITN